MMKRVIVPGVIGGKVRKIGKKRHESDEKRGKKFSL
jgi:hypothetical protein